MCPRPPRRIVSDEEIINDIRQRDPGIEIVEEFERAVSSLTNLPLPIIDHVFYDLLEFLLVWVTCYLPEETARSILNEADARRSEDRTLSPNDGKEIVFEVIDLIFERFPRHRFVTVIDQLNNIIEIAREREIEHLSTRGLGYVRIIRH